MVLRTRQINKPETPKLHITKLGLKTAIKTLKLQLPHNLSSKLPALAKLEPAGLHQPLRPNQPLNSQQNPILFQTNIPLTFVVLNLPKKDKGRQIVLGQVHGRQMLF